ncbi:glycoside hydrolase family 15 protein [Okibacterium fritillariae]|uniref:glycoside hydrolase family 15 protein n=1 Tax=Okibacterium fritillariae TaxID=123320 RepID=UPI004055475E
MSLPIEDYAVISDCHTAALVGLDGSIDWLCFPRYDSASMFGALLGDENHGRWKVAPTHPDAVNKRRYLEGTLVLVNTWTTPDGVVEIIDFMPHGNRRADLVRRVRGISGRVVVREEARFRFGYADALPWVRQITDSDGAPALVATAGPDSVILRSPKLAAEDHRHGVEFTVAAGETVDLSLTWYPSHRDTPKPEDISTVLASTAGWWRRWSDRCAHDGSYRPAVVTSLLVLRALTHEDTGGIVAAVTTSLPEQFGGSRNWDYRYVWLRDAALALGALLAHGYSDEAVGWRDWLLRAVAGDPSDVQIMYGIAGERNLPEVEVPSLPGYKGASPVRVGNGAATQFQTDVIGEVMVALHEAREAGIREDEFSWPLQRALLAYLTDNWQRPDRGIWEIRGEPQHFTHSRAMVWAAFDRAVRAVEEFGLDGPVDEWRRLRDEVRAEIDASGVSAAHGSFVQHYDADDVDAALLQLAQVGFCAYDDPRMLATVARIESELLDHDLVLRYRTESGVDGLEGTEHPFLACSFWLVEQYAHSGRQADAARLMDRLLSVTNDVGLLSEEYDVGEERQAGNTPQALSHLALVRAADAISVALGKTSLSVV